MPGNSYHGDSAKSGYSLYFLRQAPYFFTRIDKTPEMSLCQSNLLQQGILQPAGIGIYQLCRTGNSILRYHLTGQHIAQSIRHKQQFICSSIL